MSLIGIVLRNEWLTGFKSQCIIFSLYNNRKQCTNEYANLRIKFILKPW
jgi:hypothetical protein